MKNKFGNNKTIFKDGSGVEGPKSCLVLQLDKYQHILNAPEIDLKMERISSTTKVREEATTKKVGQWRHGLGDKWIMDLWRGGLSGHRKGHIGECIRKMFPQKSLAWKMKGAEFPGFLQPMGA